MADPSRPDLLIGREREVQTLRRLVVQVGEGRGGCAWLEGEPGIGKSTVLAAGLADSGQFSCQVFHGVCDELDQRFPLRVLLECLGVTPRSADADRREIAALVRSDGTTRLAVPGDALASAAERLLDLVHRLCAAAPVVLAVDDLQWADGMSLALWQRLHRATGQLPLLLVGALRPVPARTEVAAVRRGLGTRDARLDLGPLPTDAVEALLRHLVAAEPGPRLRQSAAHAGGNPLYLQELVEALLREGRVWTDGGHAEIVDAGQVLPTLTAAIRERLGFVSPRATAVLQPAALLGNEFAMVDLEALTGQDTAQLSAAVQEAVTAGVLGEAGEHLAFRHALIRQVLADALPAAVRLRLHRQAARALAAAGMPVERVAVHVLAAPDQADGWMVRWLAEAAPALVHRAPEIAVELLGQVGADHPDRGLRDLLRVHLTTALFLLGRDGEVETVARDLVITARDPEVVGRAAWALGYALNRSGRQEEAVEAVDRAITDYQLPQLWLGRMAALRAMCLVSCRRYAEAQTSVAQAKAAGERAGDRLALGYALHVAAVLHSRRTRDPARMAELTGRALAALGDEPEATDLRLMLLANRATALDNQGRLREAETAIGEALSLAEGLGATRRLAVTRLQAAQHWLYIGRWDDAAAELEGAAEELRDHPTAGPWHHGLAALLAAHRDDRPTLAAHVAAVQAIPEEVRAARRYHMTYVSVARALAAERDGAPDQALRMLLESLQPDGEPLERIEDGFLWLPDLVRLALLTGDTAAAELGTAAAEADAVHAAAGAKAAALHCRGLLLADPARLRRAAEQYAESSYPLFRAQALENAAVLLARAGHPRQARDAYASALEVYEQLDAGWDLLRAGWRLRAVGLRQGQRGARRRPATGWEALTPTELAVAARVASGLSNPDIAAQLFLSRRTVQTHVGHIMAKLGVHSRVGIARAAAEHGVPG